RVRAPFELVARHLGLVSKEPPCLRSLVPVEIPETGTVPVLKRTMASCGIPGAAVAAAKLEKEQAACIAIGSARRQIVRLRSRCGPWWLQAFATLRDRALSIAARNPPAWATDEQWRGRWLAMDGHPPFAITMIWGCPMGKRYSPRAR